jgi:hypothetical protein
MTETDQVKILCEKAREVHRVAERRYEEIVEQAEQFGELCKFLESIARKPGQLGFLEGWKNRVAYLTYE